MVGLYSERASCLSHGKLFLNNISSQLEAKTLLMAAGSLQSSKHLSSLMSLAYKENNCVEQITWNTVGSEECLDQNRVRTEVLGEKQSLILFICFYGFCF